MTSLNYINYLNIAAAFIVGIHTMDVDFGPDYEFFNQFNMREFPRKYEDGAMTPAEPFFFAFNIVALFLAVFAIVQCLPAYRGSAMVQDGVQYWFFAGSIVQSLGYATGQDRNEGFVGSFFSTLLFVAFSACTWKILNNQAYAASDSSSEEYWILRFPFSLQAGWSIAVVLMSANVLFRAGEGNDGDDGFNFNGGAFMNGFMVLASLAIYAGLSVKLLFLNGETPNYVVPAFISVITFGIAINTGEEQDNSWETVLLTLAIYLISFASAAGTAFLVYTNEYKQSSKSINEPLEDGTYEGAQITNQAENATMA
jgi:hypothetical protein